jgi:hypothetical protein
VGEDYIEKKQKRLGALQQQFPAVFETPSSALRAVLETGANTNTKTEGRGINKYINNAERERQRFVSGRRELQFRSCANSLINNRRGIRSVLFVLEKVGVITQVLAAAPFLFFSPCFCCTSSCFVPNSYNCHHYGAADLLF